MNNKNKKDLIKVEVFKTLVGLSKRKIHILHHSYPIVLCNVDGQVSYFSLEEFKTHYLPSEKELYCKTCIKLYKKYYQWKHNFYIL